MKDKLYELRARAALYAREQEPDGIVQFNMIMTEELIKLVVKECMDVVSRAGNSKAEILNDLEEMIYETDARNQG